MNTEDLGFKIFAIYDPEVSSAIRVDGTNRIIVRMCDCRKCQKFVKLDKFLEWVKEKDLKIVIEK